MDDPYVKFFRWAIDRLGDRDGIVCFVSNNSFVDQIAFDGMRRHLAQDFTAIYHLDLHGNVRKNPKLSGTTHNVFGIQVGVGITVLVGRARPPSPRKPQQVGVPISPCTARVGGRTLRRVSQSPIYYHRVPEDWRKSEKLAFLTAKQDITGIEWQTLLPDAKHTWLTEGLRGRL